MTLRNPLIRLNAHFNGRYGVDGIIADIEASVTRDDFVARVRQQLLSDTKRAIRREVEEDALAFWFWWKLS